MKTPLDIYDDMPREMRTYLSHNGWHFNKKACEFATRNMRKFNQLTKQTERIDPWSKEQVEELLEKHNLKLEHGVGYDFVYVANMAKADFFKSSIPDEQHLALFVKDYIDDIDNPGGNAFRKYYADCIAKGMPIDWGDML
jgi:hypothetical protein